MKKTLFFLIICSAFTFNGIAQTKEVFDVNSCAYSPDGEIMVLGCEKGMVQIRDDAGKLLQIIEISNKNNETGYWENEVGAVAISSDKKSIAALAFKSIHIYKSDGTFVASFPVSTEIRGDLAFVKQDSSIMFFGEHTTRYLFDISNNKLNTFDFDPDLSLPEYKRYGCNVDGVSYTKSGNFLIFYNLKMKRKYIYEHYIVEYNSENKLVRKTKIEFHPEMYSGIYFEYNREKDIVLLFHAFTSNKHEWVVQGFSYDVPTGQVKTLFGLDSYNLVRFLPSGDSLVCIGGMYTKSMRRMSLNSGQFSSFDINFDLYNAFYSPDFKKAIIRKNELVEYYTLKSSEKLCEFNNPQVVKPNDDSNNQGQQSLAQMFSIALIDTRPKIDASAIAGLSKYTYPKTLETTITGCVAGDCFDGFGYYIQNETEEFCGYFVNGVKESIGQLHRPNESLIYNGFFEAEKPNGYGSIKYYEKSLTQLCIFKNLMPDGEMTIYQYGNMKTGIYKGDQIVDIKLKTGCLSGDCKSGNGIYQLEDGTKFIGDFNANGMIKGVWFENKARIVKFESVNANNQFSGITDIFRPNGEVIHGNFLDGKLNGSGIIKTRLESKTLCVEGTFENGLATKIKVLFRDGRKWEGKQDSETAEWATGIGTMTYTDGTTKTGRFKEGEFVGE